MKREMATAWRVAGDREEMAKEARTVAMVTKEMARKRAMATAARVMATSMRVASNEEGNGDEDNEGDCNGVEGGGGATAMRVVGGEEGTGGKGDGDGDVSVGQATATKRVMATVTRVAGKQRR